MKINHLGLVLITSALLLATGPGCGGCDEDEDGECRAAHNTCVNSCDPLDSDYSGCVEACDNTLDECLEDSGCA